MIVKILVQGFPLFALILSVIAWKFPEPFASQKPLVVPLLMVIMLGMGLTLKAEDFKRVITQPKWIGIGVGLQFLFMPLLAFVLALAFQVPDEMVAGYVLLGATSGGVASNVICFLARGWVALSVSMTLVSTLLSIVLTPSITWLYVNQYIEVPIWGMMKNMLLIVVMPIGLGVIINQTFKDKMEHVHALAPAISAVGLIWIISIIMSLNAAEITTMGWTVLAVVVLHNAGGLGIGYWLIYFFSKDRKLARTIAIEVGMQNSGMSLVLANQFFSAAAAVPSAIFSIWHNITGSIFASWCNRGTDKD